MSQLRIYLPVPRLLVYKTLHLPHMTLIPPQDIAEEAEVLSTDEKYARVVLNSAKTTGYIIFQNETAEFQDGALENNLSEAISGLSGVSERDFHCHTMIELPFDSMQFQLHQASRENDEKLLWDVLDHADAALDGVRFDYCRLDVPQMSIGQPGYLSDKNMFAAYFHDEELNDGRMIAREPTNPISIPGLGLELDGPISPSDIDLLIRNSYKPDTLGVRLQRLLRFFCQSFIANSDETKILSNIFAMDGLLTPESSKYSNAFKKFVAISACHDPDSYETEYLKFSTFYRDVRNPLVHHGRTYAQLDRNRKEDLLYLQGLISRILVNLVPDHD